MSLNIFIHIFITYIDVCVLDSKSLCNRYKAFAVSRMVGYHYTGLTTPVTLTDRPKSVRNRCVIEVFL